MRLTALIFALFAYLSDFATAAPHPTTSASITNQVTAGTFAQLGFKLNDVPGDWAFTRKDTEAKQIDIKKNSARISFTSEEMNSVNVDLQSYVKRYLRDYNQFGFEISGLQSIKSQNRAVSVVLDLHQKNKKTQGRQVFFQRGKKIVTATCMDETEAFQESIKDCNKILGSFTWR